MLQQYVQRLSLGLTALSPHVTLRLLRRDTVLGGMTAQFHNSQVVSQLVPLFYLTSSGVSRLYSQIFGEHPRKISLFSRVMQGPASAADCDWLMMTLFGS